MAPDAKKFSRFQLYGNHAHNLWLIDNLLDCLQRYYLTKTFQTGCTDDLMAHYWKITSDSIKQKFKNETTRRINRNLWNNLTIDVNMQMDFKIVKHSYESDIAYTCYDWDYWISCIPARAQLEQINELVSAVLNSTLGPQEAVKRLNRHFQTMSWFSLFSRASLFVSIHAV